MNEEIKNENVETQEVVADVVKDEKKRGQDVKRDKKNGERRERRREESEYDKSLVSVRRVTKVVKG